MSRRSFFRNPSRRPTSRPEHAHGMAYENLVSAVRAVTRSLDGEAFAAILRAAHPINVVEALDECTDARTAALLLTLKPDVRAHLLLHFDAPRRDVLLQALRRDPASHFSGTPFATDPLTDMAVIRAMDLENTERSAQLARFSGTPTYRGKDLDVLSSPLRQLFGVRLFWLSILTIFGMIGSAFVLRQEALLSEAIILAAFIAPIVDMGGNAGSQSTTLVLRGMALGQLQLDWRCIWVVIKRELPVAASLGLVIAALKVVLTFFSGDIANEVLLVVGLSMLTCTMLGSVIGAALPFLARFIRADPATLSAPLITSIMDLLGILIYFGLAYAFLGHLLV